MENNTPERDLWTQKEIHYNLFIYGFFEFEVGISKKDEEPYCVMKGISKLNIRRFIKEAGFRKRYLPRSDTFLMVHVKDNVIKPVTIDLIRVESDKELQAQYSTSIYYRSREFTFKTEYMMTMWLNQQHNIFNKNFLELMDEYSVPELKDTRDSSYFLFKNGIIEVNSELTKYINYSDLEKLNKCVWKSHIMDREYIEHDINGVSEFEKFINNVSNQDPARIRAFKTGIGYLLHNYNGSHMGQGVILYDEAPTDAKNPQGGTGKGLFAQGIGKMRETARINGKQFDPADKFKFQTVNVTSQVVFFDDLKKDVTLDHFFNELTEGWEVEKKYADKFQIAVEDSPKTFFAKNTIFEGKGSSDVRRSFILELSDYYSKHIKVGNEHPIEDEHGILFDRFKWTQRDWDLFTKFMIDCLSFYLKNDLQPYELINVGKNRLIQTTSEDFATWVSEKDFMPGFSYDTKMMYEDFKAVYYGPTDTDYKQRTFTNSMKKFAGSKGWDIEVKTDPATKASRFSFHEKS